MAEWGQGASKSRPQTPPQICTLDGCSSAWPGPWPGLTGGQEAGGHLFFAFSLANTSPLGLVLEARALKLRSEQRGFAEGWAPD